MPLTPAQRKAHKKYEKKTYSEIKIKPKVAESERIRKHATERGESLTRFLVRSAETQIEMDKNDDITPKETK